MHYFSLQIGFHMGKDGNPWVWVFGDYLGDPSYDELIAKRESEERTKEQESTRKAAEKLARRESMTFGGGRLCM